MATTRREFLKEGALLGATVAAARAFGAERSSPAFPSNPVVIASANGLAAVTKAMEVIRGGGDVLDGVIEGVTLVEDDPNDTSVGYGGLPNEEGVVELDAAVMHGPTCRGGAVAALRNIKNPSRVARVVMERSDHVLLVGEGALRFARAHGFQEQNLLTDRARQQWLKWKETLSPGDDWLPPHTPVDEDLGGVFAPFYRHTGTIHCSGVDTRGNVSCVTTTSGLAFKLPGRVGDSPIFGAGLYVDNEVGAAGSTGRGEANMLSCGSVMIVEWMREGKSPEEACLLACRRVADRTKMRRLLTDDGKPTFDIRFFALNRKGEYGGASIYEGASFAVHDGMEAKLLPCAHLFAKRGK